MDADRQAWLAAHPYLGAIARFQRIVEEAAAPGARAALLAPRWDSRDQDLATGVPLLRSAAGPGFSAAAADELRDLVACLAGAPLPDGIASACQELREAIPRSPGAWSQAMSFIVEGGPAASAPVHPGLLRLLGWTAVRRVLEPARAERAAGWEEGPWDGCECPVCGSLPVMAQLVPSDGARRRFLACGCCGTRWRFTRIGCPFCGNGAPERLGILQVKEEERLRIDVCDECGGYLKTYAGEGDEELFLADWSTLHLDLLARDRGLRRVGASLYELPELPSELPHDERPVDP